MLSAPPYLRHAECVHQQESVVHFISYIFILHCRAVRTILRVSTRVYGRMYLIKSIVKRFRFSLAFCNTNILFVVFLRGLYQLKQSQHPYVYFTPLRPSLVLSSRGKYPEIMQSKRRKIKLSVYALCNPKHCENSLSYLCSLTSVLTFVFVSQSLNANQAIK